MRIRLMEPRISAAALARCLGDVLRRVRSRREPLVVERNGATTAQPAPLPAGTRQGSTWQRHFFYRKGSIKTTWKLRLAMLTLVILIGSLTRGFWIPRIGQSLVCRQEIGPSDVILVENFDPAYLLFERAAALQHAGLAARVLVPTQASSRDPEVTNAVSKGIAELMARLARVQDVEIMPIREIEPISLGAAYQIRDFLRQQSRTGR